MTDAFECDRCGELYGEPPEIKVATDGLENAGGEVRLKKKSTSRNNHIAMNTMMDTPNAIYQIKQGDLCEDCAEGFREFWGDDMSNSVGGTHREDIRMRTDENGPVLDVDGIKIHLRVSSYSEEYIDSDADSVITEVDHMDEHTWWCVYPEDDLDNYVEITPTVSEEDE